jgi:hypothetical protein
VEDKFGKKRHNEFTPEKSKHGPYKRIRHADAQCENYQRILGIFSGLNGVIPLVEHLGKRTNKAGKQHKRNSYL